MEKNFEHKIENSLVIRLKIREWVLEGYWGGQ